MLLGSAILETAIGVTFIYILLALLCSVVNEWLARTFDLRRRFLRHEVHRILGPHLAAELWDHPLIHGLFEGGKYPNYIPSSTFALAMLQLSFTYAPGAGGLPGTTAVLPKWVGKEKALLEGLRQYATSPGPIQTRVEKWFDLGMEQASGAYKRAVHLIVLAFSLGMVAAANIDTIAIVASLYSGALGHKATEFAIGWFRPSAADAVPFGVPLKIAGLAMTWAAASLGAPFWFDLLNKFVNLRQTGLPPDENKRDTSGARMVAQ
jgi:hypothetical protein